MYILNLNEGKKNTSKPNYINVQILLGVNKSFKKGPTLAAAVLRLLKVKTDLDWHPSLRL